QLYILAPALGAATSKPSTPSCFNCAWNSLAHVGRQHQKNSQIPATFNFKANPNNLHLAF
ncbi:hypothetical protein A2U01_0078807, partial [Trifolium medium]|nr:hypothetical protein [Trifolium medium]